MEKNFLDPIVISKLSRMDIRARLIVEGFISGLHKSPYHGFSVEFAEHRQYFPGDELKHIDWKVFGRMDKFYVKEYEEETNLSCHILLDCSGSMEYTSEEITKLEYSSYLAAALAYVLIRQQDSVGLVTFDEKIRKIIPPKSSPVILKNILRELEIIKPGGKTNIEEILHSLALRIKKRGLIILISDLFDNPENVLAGLKHFRHKKHEVIVFHIMDKNEYELPFKKTILFKDIETGEEIISEPETLKKEYKNMLNSFINKYKKECFENNIDYYQINTKTSYDKVLFDYLSKRKKLM